MSVFLGFVRFNRIRRGWPLVLIRSRKACILEVNSSKRRTVDDHSLSFKKLVRSATAEFAQLEHLISVVVSFKPIVLPSSYIRF